MLEIRYPTSANTRVCGVSGVRDSPQTRLGRARLRKSSRNADFSEQAIDFIREFPAQFVIDLSS
jgi:hypothetical protein